MTEDLFNELDQLIDDLEFDDSSEENEIKDNKNIQDIDFYTFIKHIFDSIANSVDVETSLNVIIDAMMDFLFLDSCIMLKHDNEIILERDFIKNHNSILNDIKEEKILEWVKIERKSTVYEKNNTSFIIAPLLIESEFDGFFIACSQNITITPKFHNLFNISTSILAIFYTKMKLYKELLQNSDHLEIKVNEVKHLYNELLIIHDFVKKAGSIFDIPDLLDTLKDLTIKAASPNKCFVLTYNEKSNNFIVSSSTVEEKKGKILPVIDILAETVENKKIIKIKEVESEFLKKTFQAYSILSIPIFFKENIYGILLMTERFTNKPYSKEDVELLKSLTRQTENSLENIRLYNQYVEKQKIERDLELARNIQKNLLPEHPPEMPMLEISGLSLPARQVGGDYFDYLKLDDDHIWIFLGDVSGKGISASILMAMVRSYLKSEIRNAGDSPGELLTNVNDLVVNDIYEGKFITFIAVYVDLSKNKIYYSNAGHLPALHMTKNNEEPFEYGADNLPIGIIENIKYPTRSASFENGDVLVLYTDGINEAMNLKSEEYGFEKLVKNIKDHRKDSTKKLLNIIIRDVEKWSKGAPQHDDTTMVIIKHSDKNKKEFTDEFYIENDINQINDVVEDLVVFLKELEISDDEIFDIKLVLSELLINAAKHGNKFDKDKKIKLYYNITKEKIITRIYDEGDGFDHKEISDYDDRLLEENGRGIILVSSIADRVKYIGKGNIVEFEKWFRGYGI